MFLLAVLLAKLGKGLEDRGGQVPSWKRDVLKREASSDTYSTEKSMAIEAVGSTNIVIL